MATRKAKSATALPWQWPEETWRGIVGKVRAGRSLRPAQWKDGARVAVALSFDSDHESGTLREGESSPGKLSQGEYGARQGVPRILALLENFEGWEKGANWGELDFLFAHGNEIEKIAIAGDPAWEGQALAFAGAGFRKAPVKFFPAGDLAAARTSYRAWRTLCERLARGERGQPAAFLLFGTEAVDRHGAERDRRLQGDRH